MSQFPWDCSSLSTETASQGPPQSWMNQAAGLLAKSGSGPGPSVRSRVPLGQALPPCGPQGPIFSAPLSHSCFCTVQCGHAQVLTSTLLSTWTVVGRESQKCQGLEPSPKADGLEARCQNQRCQVHAPSKVWLLPWLFQLPMAPGIPWPVASHSHLCPHLCMALSAACAQIALFSQGPWSLE